MDYVPARAGWRQHIPIGKGHSTRAEGGGFEWTVQERLNKDTEDLARTIIQQPKNLIGAITKIVVKTAFLWCALVLHNPLSAARVE